jgi:hypothetical protein
MIFEKPLKFGRLLMRYASLPEMRTPYNDREINHFRCEAIFDANLIPSALRGPSPFP